MILQIGALMLYAVILVVAPFVALVWLRDTVYQAYKQSSTAPEQTEMLPSSQTEESNARAILLKRWQQGQTL